MSTKPDFKLAAVRGLVLPYYDKVEKRTAWIGGVQKLDVDDRSLGVNLMLPVADKAKAQDVIERWLAAAKDDLATDHNVTAPHFNDHYAPDVLADIIKLVERGGDPVIFLGRLDLVPAMKH